MNEEIEAETLARRAVACPKFRWMAGMLTTGDVRVLAIQPFPSMAHVRVVAREAGPAGRRVVWHRTDSGAQPAHILPDLTDPATLGCLLALVREAWGRPDFVTRARRPGGPLLEWLWWIDGDPCPTPGGQDTEAATLVAALEAAP